MKYFYFVAYSYTTMQNGFGFGNMEVSLENPITNLLQLHNISTKIQEIKAAGTNVVISNFQLLRTE